MARKQQRQGAMGENRGMIALRTLGIQMLVEIPTAMKAIRIDGQKNAYQVRRTKKADGDIRGILPNGISVLAEVKSAEGPHLFWSELRKHQPVQLQAHTDNNGLSLLVWASDTRTYVMRWPIEGFGPGQGISKQRASELDDELSVYLEPITRFVHILSYEEGRPDETRQMFYEQETLHHLIKDES